MTGDDDKSVSEGGRGCGFAMLYCMAADDDDDKSVSEVRRGCGFAMVYCMAADDDDDKSDVGAMPSSS